MAVTAICLKNTRHYLQGDIVLSFPRETGGIQKWYTSKINSDMDLIESKYTPLDTSEFRNFTWINNYMCVDYMGEESTLSNFLRRIFHMKQSKVEMYKFVQFDMNGATMFRLYKEALIYLLLVEDKELLLTLADTIEYQLMSIAVLYKVKDRIDFEKSLTNIAEVCKGIYTYSLSIIEEPTLQAEISLNDKINSILPRYAKIVEAQKNMLREFTKY